ncbi:SdrD B-like domain-containing protein [Phaeodactylibacter luteus]|uniref:T9SS type A sorting domain-containing protein n=1 Tax=Phaeodactylibacter luteus TaxID=1564516 RepID=A0A5C6RNN7_9BACT|nr:SdrD B-like domain-containing protein [Phaeodactylibacter luteus]TXB63594.1 T9SS type A sorting domain-containing protein [Phaeodactylibacter luteus]
MKQPLPVQPLPNYAWRKPTWAGTLLACCLLLGAYSTANAQFSVGFDVTEPRCFAQPTGSVTALPAGGTAPYSYLWSNGQTGPTIANITAGSYSVTVTDASSNSVVESVTVTQPTIVNVTLTATQCELPIVITAVGSGGIPGYTYNWNDGQNGAEISVPGAGTFCVTMTDENLCGAVQCIDVAFTPLNVLVDANDISCPDEEDGSVSAIVTSGTPPYNFQWSNGATTQTVTNLAPGTYTVTVTDGGGCTDTATGTVDSPPPIIANIDSNGPTCVGEGDGSATVFATGGTPPFSYLWNTGATGPALSGLTAGTYTVTVSDINGCIAVESTTLTPISSLNASLLVNDESCPDANDGTMTAFPVNGVQPFSYLWSNGQTTQTITNLAPGAYTVTVTDGVGCTDTETGTVNPAADFDIAVTGSDVTICDGTNGSAMVNIIAGEGPFTFAWSNGGTTQMIANLSGGTYTVTVTDANQCTEEGSVLINTPPDLTASITTSESAVCLGEATATATANATGGTPPFSYLWSTGETTQQITGLGAGTYTVTITDAALCSDVASTVIEDAPELFVTVSGDESVCAPETLGFAAASPSGGTPPYNYLWSNGETTPSIAGLPEGEYSVTVTDALGCFATGSITIDIVDDLAVNGTRQSPDCFGENTGAISTAPTGGTSPYSYQWSNGETTPAIQNLAAGIYTVTVTDANGCAVAQTFLLPQPPEFTAAATGSDFVCPGESNGTAMVMATGGTPPYAYLWSNGETTQMVSGLAAGTYTVTVTDDNDCEAIAEVTLESAEGILVNIDAPEVVCGAENTGNATVTASGGVPPYTFEWSTGESDTSIENLPEGTYSVTVTDANGCSTVEEVFIEVVEDFAISIVARDILCNGDSTGTILVTATGGTMPYTFSWSTGLMETGVTQSEIIALPAGMYMITVTDSNDCILSETINLMEADPIVLDIAVTDPTCAGEADGQAVINFSGGNVSPPAVPYMVDINGVSYEVGPSGTLTLDGLQGPDTLIIQTTDGNFCQVLDTAIIGQPSPIDITLSPQSPPCNGDPLGSVQSAVDGGTPPYTYLWSNGAMTPSLMGISAGNYSVTVTDANDCTAVDSVMVVEPELLSIELEKRDVFCDEVNTGYIVATPAGGTSPYSYEWSNGATTDSIGGLAPGQYTVTVLDANECMMMASITIQSFPELELTPIATAPSCFDDANGAATVVVNGGTPPFTFEWSNGSTDSLQLGLPDGVYTVTVTDAVGCTGTEAIAVSQPDELIALIEADSVTDVSCFGFMDGAAAVTVSGGTPPYTYLWSNGAETPGISGVEAGTYTVSVTDINDCTAQAEVTIGQPGEFVVALDAATAATCEDEANGAITSMVTGGTPPYDYLWSNGATTPDISMLAAGTYTLTVTDANDCFVAAFVDIAEFDSPTCTVEIGQEVTMADNGALNVVVNGGTAPFDFLWSNGETTPIITGLTPGTYSVTVTDANGCTTTCEATLDGFVAIGNYVWEDLDRDGQQDGNEPPFPGVEVQLKDAGNNVIATDTTDENGNYLFMELPAGTYSVAFVLPDSFRFTFPNMGDDVLDSDANPNMGGMTQQVTLMNGEIDTTLDAGIYLLPYDDIEDPCICLNNSTTDENGQFLEILTIYSYPNENWTIVEQDGMFDINSPEPPAPPIPVSPGTVIPESATPGAYTFSFKLVDATPYVIFSVTNGFDTLTIDNVCFYPDINLQELPPEELCIFDEPFVPQADPSIPGTLTFYINGIPVDVIDPAALGAGQYQFTAELVPDDPVECTTTIITDFAVVGDCGSTLGDFVWLDENRNGIQDPNEDGIAGVMVILQVPGESDPINIDTTFTDANGLYSFTVAPGDYKLQFMQPSGLVFTEPNAGADDAIDSDVDPDMGMTGIYNIETEEDDLTIDAGLYTKCDNITDPGLIGPNQFLCGPGNDPEPIVNIESPSGGSGEIEYLWMRSTIAGPFNLQTWQIIPGATGDSYDPGPLSETTFFARCARRECCVIYLESNIVEIEVGNVAVADIAGPDFLCVDEPTTFFAAQAGPGAIIEWTFGLGLTPSSATGPTAEVTAISHGNFDITLEVTENGCTSTQTQRITATTSPIYCGLPMPLNVEVTNEEQGEVLISWIVDENLVGHNFIVQHSRDGETFSEIGQVDEPTAFLGSMGYYEFEHEAPKRGCNLYRVIIINPEGEIFYSEIGEAILANDSKIALLYPNPTEDVATLEILESFGEDIQIELLSATGNLIFSRNLEVDAKMIQIDTDGLPAGTYFLKVRYAKAGLKVLKLVKR